MQLLLGAKGFIYAYLRLGLPILLFLLLDGREDQGPLIMATGYRPATTSVLPTKDLSLTSDVRNWLYAYADRMGPFARYGFTDDGKLLTPWSTGDDREPGER